LFWLCAEPAAANVQNGVTGEGPGLAMEIHARVLRMSGEPGYIQVQDGGVLRSGDGIQFHLETRQDSFVYLIAKGSSGRVNVLRPFSGRFEDARISAGERTVFPAQEIFLPLDERTGQELVFGIATEQPIRNLSSLLSRMEGAGGDPDSVTRVVAGAFPATRRISFRHIGRAPLVGIGLAGVPSTGPVRSDLRGRPRRGGDGAQVQVTNTSLPARNSDAALAGALPWAQENQEQVLGASGRKIAHLTGRLPPVKSTASDTEMVSDNAVRTASAPAAQASADLRKGQDTAGESSDGGLANTLKRWFGFGSPGADAPKPANSPEAARTPAKPPAEPSAASAKTFGLPPTSKLAVQKTATQPRTASTSSGGAPSAPLQPASAQPAQPGIRSGASAARKSPASSAPTQPAAFGFEGSNDAEASGPGDQVLSIPPPSGEPWPHPVSPEALVKGEERERVSGDNSDPLPPQSQSSAAAALVSASQPSDSAAPQTGRADARPSRSTISSESRASTPISDVPDPRAQVSSQRQASYESATSTATQMGRTVATQRAGNAEAMAPQSSLLGDLAVLFGVTGDAPSTESDKIRGSEVAQVREVRASGTAKHVDSSVGSARTSTVEAESAADLDRAHLAKSESTQAMALDERSPEQPQSKAGDSLAALFGLGNLGGSVSSAERMKQRAAATSKVLPELESDSEFTSPATRVATSAGAAEPNATNKQVTDARLREVEPRSEAQSDVETTPKGNADGLGGLAALFGIGAHPTRQGEANASIEADNRAAPDRSVSVEAASSTSAPAVPETARMSDSEILNNGQVRIVEVEPTKTQTALAVPTTGQASTDVKGLLSSRSLPVVESAAIADVVKKGGIAGSAALVLSPLRRGSGVVVDARGFILTSWQIVRGLTDVNVLIHAVTDGNAAISAIVPARVVKLSRLSDLALLQLTRLPGELTVVRFGKSGALAEGAVVHAIGHREDGTWTHTLGKVTEVHAQSSWHSEPKVLHRAAVVESRLLDRPGAVGVPLFNNELELVGLGVYWSAEHEQLTSVAGDSIRAFLVSPTWLATASPSGD